MRNSDELFDRKMKEKFKRETLIIPENINNEFDKIIEIERKKEKFNMGKLKKFGITAASLLFVSTLVMNTAFAQDVVKNIVKSLSIHGLTVFENKTEEDIWKKPIPKAYKGKIFDQNGNVVEEVNKDNMENLYLADGTHVWVTEDGDVFTDEQIEELRMKNAEENADMFLEITDINELGKHISFNPQLPEYIPEGFTFNKAQCGNYKKEKLDSSNWYGLEYENKKNGEKIYIQVTELIDEEKGETSFDNIEQGKVNGNDAIISDNSITWTDGNINYIVFMYDLGKNEGLKISESIK